MVRDLEYDWQTLVEIWQIPVTFRLLITAYKDDRDQATPMPIEIVVSTKLEAIVHRRFPGTITFEPLPLGYALKFGDDSKQLGLVT